VAFCQERLFQLQQLQQAQEIEEKQQQQQQEQHRSASRSRRSDAVPSFSSVLGPPVTNASILERVVVLGIAMQHNCLHTFACSFSVALCFFDFL
jgi:hypothetical protein